MDVFPIQDIKLQIFCQFCLKKCWKKILHQKKKYFKKISGCKAENELAVGQMAGLQRKQGNSQLGDPCVVQGDMIGRGLGGGNGDEEKGVK